eukprot:3332111-Prymnesium_polylepis.2
MRQDVLTTGTTLHALALRPRVCAHPQLFTSVGGQCVKSICVLVEWRPKYLPTPSLSAMGSVDSQPTRTRCAALKLASQSDSSATCCRYVSTGSGRLMCAPAR